MIHRPNSTALKNWLVVGLLLLFSSNIGLAIYFVDLSQKYSDRADTLYRQILLEVGIPADSVANYPRWDASSDTLIARSPRRVEHARLEGLENRSFSIGIFLFVVLFMVWPGVVLGLFGAMLHRYWRAEGLDTSVVQSRRDKVRVVSTATTLVTFTLLIAVWRISFSASLISFSQWVIWGVGVCISGIVLIYLVWSLLASPRSRISATVQSLPKTYRTCAQAILIGIVSWFAASDLRNHDSFADSQPDLALLVNQTLVWVSFLVAFGASMLAYLRPSTEIQVQESFHVRSSLEPPSRITPSPTTVIREAPDAGETLASNESLRSMEHRIAGLLAESARELSSVSVRLQERKQPQLPKEVLHDYSALIRNRLLGEVKELTKRGNLNLTIGSVTTLMAAGILWLLVVQSPEMAHTEVNQTLGRDSVAVGSQPTPQILNTSILLSYYLPRLSLAIFIEVFSFFFLRLYKRSLSDIRYYQNELTNVEARLLALEFATTSVGSPALESILRDLSALDRNFLLKSGETTVELEKIRGEQEDLKSIVNGILAKLPSVTGPK